ncbi:MAG: FliO/MopB family protein, partial [Candidatus Riflebacteria bacterium]|nr:FliO/MopB family protein [Candidatus Riflebacteria bacterium]
SLKNLINVKKAINLTLLVIYVLIALFVCNQTVVAGNGLFLANNNSNAAQDFIKATKIGTSSVEQETEQFVSVKAKEEENISTNTASTSALASGTKKTVIDEGSLPLFSEKTPTNTNRLPSPTNGMSGTFSLIISLFGIIVLALAASWFIQKKTGFGSNNFGKVLGIVPLDNKRLIYIVDVMGKMMVLGVTESSINFLTEITDKDTIDAYRLKYGQSVTPGLDKLFPFMNKGSDEQNNDSNLSDEASRIIEEKKAEQVKSTLDKNHEDRLKRLKNMIIKANNK